MAVGPPTEVVPGYSHFHLLAIDITGLPRFVFNTSALRRELTLNRVLSILEHF